jgi:serine/threonine protein kinase
VFNAIAGRYPLADRGEIDGRASGKEREVFQKQLAKRAANEWDKWVHGGLHERVPHDGLADVLRRALERDPAHRPSADELVRRCRRDLSALVRATSQPAGMSPSQRLLPLNEFLPPAELLLQMPAHKRLDLKTSSWNPTVALGGPTSVWRASCASSSAMRRGGQPHDRATDEDPTQAPAWLRRPVPATPRRCCRSPDADLATGNAA